MQSQISLDRLIRWGQLYFWTAMWEEGIRMAPQLVASWGYKTQEKKNKCDLGWLYMNLLNWNTFIISYINYHVWCIQLWIWNNWPHMAQAFPRALHTHTLGRTPLDEWSARRRDLYLRTHNTHRDINASGGIRTRNRNKQAGPNLRFRPRASLGSATVTRPAK